MADSPPKEAVALRYEPKKDGAPRVAAKGKRKLARRIIALAREAGIPVQEDPDLVHLLSQLDWHEEIPESLYQAVAEILAFLYTVNGKAS